MLVLSRQRDQSIILGGDDVVATVVDIRGDKVRIGITAPRNFPVHRMEVWQAIKKDLRERDHRRELRAHPFEGMMFETFAHETGYRAEIPGVDDWYVMASDRDECVREAHAKIRSLVLDRVGGAA